MSKVGRPRGLTVDCQYSEEKLNIAKAMAKLGATDFEIYTELGVNKATYYRWRWQFPQFAAAIALGKKMADDRVERALYSRAVGYDYDAEKLITVSQGQGVGSVVERHDVVEHVPPDVRAIEYWLNNRRPKQWQSKVTQENTGTLKFETIQRDTKDLAV